MVSVLCCLCVLTRRKSVQASAEQTCMGQASSQIMLVYPALANVQAHVAHVVHDLGRTNVVLGRALMTIKCHYF